jgi:hypothetical protein
MTVYRLNSYYYLFRVAAEGYIKVSENWNSVKELKGIKHIVFYNALEMSLYIISLLISIKFIS